MNRRTVPGGLCGLELCVQPRVLGGAFHFTGSSHILGNLTFSLPSHTFFSLFLELLGFCDTAEGTSCSVLVTAAHSHS